MGPKLYPNEVEDYRRLFYWFRYQFYIRSESFRVRFDRMEEGSQFELLFEKGSDFFYIASLALDDLANFEDYPIPGWSTSEIHTGKGRPKGPAPGSKPAKKSSAILPVRSDIWEKFILKSCDLARKNPGGDKKTGDFFWPFPLWEKSLLVYDLLEHGLKNIEVGKLVNGRTIAEVLEVTQDRGVRPIKYDLLSRAFEHFSPLSIAPVGTIAAQPPKFERDPAVRNPQEKKAEELRDQAEAGPPWVPGSMTFFISPRQKVPQRLASGKKGKTLVKKDPENLRRELLAYVSDERERTVNLIRSAEAGHFPSRI